MKTLILDASYNQKVALLEDGKVICEKENNMQRADLFMKEVDSLLSGCKVSISDIDQIAINIGPGSFTGIRVAVSVAKGLGFAKNLGYIEFNSFDYFPNKNNVVLTGFSNFVYVKDNSGKLDCIDIKELYKNTVYYVCDDSLKSKLEENGFSCVLENIISFDNMPAIVDGKVISISEIRPLYLRKSQAEIQRESRLKGNL